MVIGKVQELLLKRWAVLLLIAVFLARCLGWAALVVVTDHPLDFYSYLYCFRGRFAYERVVREIAGSMIRFYIAGRFADQ